MKINTLSIVVALLVSGSAVYGQSDVNQDQTIYQIAKRLNNYTRPITFTPTKAIAVNGSITENIVTTTQNIVNKEAPFLKKGIVKPVGEDQFSAWEAVSDERGAGHNQTAPNPLTYYAAGSASSLLTQVERAIQVMGLDVKDVKVESEIFFRWSDTMSDKWSGYTDKVVSNILISSNEPASKIKELKQMAIKAWAVGEGLANKSTIDVGIQVNTDNWAGLQAHLGKVGTPLSKDNGQIITNITPDLNNVLQTIKVKDDFSIDMHKFPSSMAFSEIVIAQSANDKTRPFMHKIRAKSLTENYATWELYTDDSRGYEGIDKAPTSRDYFTLGTSFCLMSQLTAAKGYYHQKGINIDNYRVEHQFDYVQDNFMTPSMNGHLDNVITKVIVTSDAKKEELVKYAKQALSMCFAGEGIQNETEMETSVYLNGKVVK
ncbi:OsmC family protein [Poseidonibacter antarcticus]|uniref:OsmC family protein n=1 Tax=Poseidonibacter antarcticus TaxID=2478538 RepID=UPI000EF4C531|nr:OsmC family protein [Poseidonibacter antarcticus]